MTLLNKQNYYSKNAQGPPRISPDLRTISEYTTINI